MRFGPEFRRFSMTARRPGRRAWPAGDAGVWRGVWFVMPIASRAALAGLLLLLSTASAVAQETGAPGAYAARGSRRLMQRFIEDAVVVPGGWVEAQYQYANLEDGERQFVGTLFAFRLTPSFEAGLRFGFLDVGRDTGPDGSGLSDIDLYGKYRMPTGNRQAVAFGGVLKAPTADEEEGLGTGETDLEVFAAYRADLDGVSFVLNAGARFNGDAALPLASSKDSYQLGGGLLLPATDRMTLMIEATFETERIDNGTNDARLAVGMQRYGRKGRGGFRAGVSMPLTDGAPDYEVLLGGYITY